MVHAHQTCTVGLLIAAAVGHAFGQQVSYPIHGTIRDAVTKEAVSAATVRVPGTSRGTIANAQGAFALDMPTGFTIVIVSSLGYAPDTLTVSNNAGAYDVRLTPSDIVMPEVVVSSEDPAIEIIRRAIARKHRWIDRLASYSMDAFTRQLIRRDTAIASVTESMTHGYWRTGDTLREVIVQRRQTRNVPESFNFAAVGVILNFNEDHVHFVGFDFVGPTATDALDYYDFKLIRTRVSSGHDVYDIAMHPAARTVPLFAGTVSIAGDSYALVGVDVQPNEAFGLPFVNDFTIRYRQQFALFDSTFWMPIDIRISAHASISIPGISFPPIGFEQTSSITSYAINIPLPDSVFHKPRVSVDSVATRPDSSAWTSHAVIPMTTEEQQAYQTLDSSKTLEAQFRPDGLLLFASVGNGGVISALSYLDLAFNRVEGAHVGVSKQFNSLSAYIVPRGQFAYGFSAKKSTWEIGTMVFTDMHRHFGIGGSVYRRFQRTPGWQAYDPFFNGLAALLAKTDIYDFYRAEGWNALTEFAPSGVLNLRLTFTHENESSAPVVTEYSLFYPHRQFRDNPPADPGRLRSIRLDFRLGREPLPIDFISYDGLGVSIEKSSRSFLSSDYEFTRYDAYGTISIVTFGRSFLFKPQLRLRASAGTSTGTLPLQRYFSVESGAAGTAPFGVMYSMGLKEFRGTSYFAIGAEHNFRNLLFLFLGIPQSIRRSLEILIHGGVANTWGEGPFPHHAEGWFSEAGFGISRIIDLFRVDATWRLSPPGEFVITFGIATLF